MCCFPPGKHLPLGSDFAKSEAHADLTMTTPDMLAIWDGSVWWEHLTRIQTNNDVPCLLLTTGKAKSDIWARPCSHPKWPVCCVVWRRRGSPILYLRCLICWCFPGDIHWFRRLYGSLPVVFDPFVVRSKGATWRSAMMSTSGSCECCVETEACLVLWSRTGARG